MLNLHAVNITPLVLCDDKEHTRDDGTSDYDVLVGINDRVIWRGEVKRHLRANGAAALLRMIADRMDHSAGQTVSGPVPQSNR